MAAPRARCSPSRRSSAWPGCCVERFGVDGRSASPAASPPCGPTCRCWSSKLAALPRRPRPHHQRRHAPARAPHDLAAAGLRRVNISLDSLRPERFAELTRRDELDRRARRHRRRRRGRARAGEDQRRRGARASTTTRSSTSPRSGATGASRCASSSSCRSTRGGAWTQRPGRHPGRDRRAHRRRCSRSSRCSAGPRAGRALPLPRRRRRGRASSRASPAPFCEHCDRVRLTADGQLRTCLFALEDHDLRAVLLRRGGDRRRPGRRHRGRAWARSGPATRSTRCTSCRPRRSMSQIGG